MEKVNAVSMPKWWIFTYCIKGDYMTGKSFTAAFLLIDSSNSQSLNSVVLVVNMCLYSLDIFMYARRWHKIYYHFHNLLKNPYLTFFLYFFICGFMHQKVPLSFSIKPAVFVTDACKWALFWVTAPYHTLLHKTSQITINLKNGHDVSVCVFNGLCLTMFMY